MWSAEHWSIGLSPTGVELLRQGSPLVRCLVPGPARDDGDSVPVTPANAGVQGTAAVDSGVRRNDGAYEVVTPANAGVQGTAAMDSGVRRNDGGNEVVTPANAGVQGTAAMDSAVRRNDGEYEVVTPANAGVQGMTAMDSGVRRNDGVGAEILLAALDELLAAHAPKGRRVAVTVRLSSHLVRFALLPWQDELVTPREIALAARHRIDRLYGEAAAADRVWVDQPAWGQPGVICAVNAALLDGITARLAGPSFRLMAIEPALLAHCNALGRTRRDGGIALVEPGRIGIASFVGGRWQSLAARRVGRDGGVLALRQEIARLDVSPPPGEWLIQRVGDDAPAFDFPGRVLPAIPLAACGRSGA